MEIQKIDIPKIPIIKIQTYLPSTNQSLNIALPRIDMAGCTKAHRDTSVKNTQIILMIQTELIIAVQQGMESHHIYQ